MINENAIILSGGKATRLSPLSDNLPKSLIEIKGKPFLYWQIELLKSKGIKNIILSLGHMKEKIEKYVIENNCFDINIKLVDDGKSSKGTGGAVKKASGIANDVFFVINGDSYTDIDFELLRNKYYESKFPAMMTIFKNTNAYDKSNISIRGDKVVYYKKENKDNNILYIDYGVSIFSKDIFKNYKKDRFDLEEVYQDLIEKNALTYFEVYDRFYEIGSFDGIKDFENYLNQK